MTQPMPDDLWRDFPKTATEFEARFATEEDWRAYWIKVRWGGEPACAMRQQAALDDPLRHHIRMRGLPTSPAGSPAVDQPDVRYAAGEDA